MSGMMRRKYLDAEYAKMSGWGWLQKLESQREEKGC